MDCKYILVRDTYSDNTDAHIGYGIVAVDHEHVALSAALDLSSDENKVADLVKKCNELNLSLIHFPDVVEDFLN